MEISTFSAKPCFDLFSSHLDVQELETPIYRSDETIVVRGKTMEILIKELYISYSQLL